MFEEPLMLVKLLNILKGDCYRAVLPSHVLHCFFRYCTIADAILDAAKKLESTRNSDAKLIEVHCGYFVRDVWFFVCRFLLHSELALSTFSGFPNSVFPSTAGKCGQLHRSALEYVEVMLEKGSFLTQQVTAHMDQLAKLLIACVKHVETKELKMMATQKLVAYINMYKAKLQVQALLDESGDDCEYLQTLRNLFETTLPKISKQSVVDYIHAFLKPNRLERLHGLREYVSCFYLYLYIVHFTFECIFRLLSTRRSCRTMNSCCSS